MTDTSPTPADRPADGRTTWPTAEPLQQAADLRRAAGDPLLADWLDATANALAWLAPYRDNEPGYGMWEAALAVARQLLGTTSCGCPHPVDEHSVYGCAEDCACEWMPPRTPAAPPAPADRAAVLRWVADDLRQTADATFQPYYRTAYRTAANHYERLADDAAAGVQPPTTTEAGLSYRLEHRHREEDTWRPNTPGIGANWSWRSREKAEQRLVEARDRWPDFEHRLIEKTTTVTEQPAAPAAPEETQ